MSKRFLQAALIASLVATRNDWSSTYMNKNMDGSPIYIPKRHKFKRRNKK